MIKKAILLILLAIVTTFALTACGGGNRGKNNGSKDSVPDLNAAIGGAGKLSEYDALARQTMIDAAKKAGGNLEFKSDGSAVYTDSSGNISIQHSDGTWTFQNSDGDVVTIGGEWPDNEFTKLLPKPDFTLTGARTTETEYTVVFLNVTLEQIKAYVEKVKAKGFTENEKVEDTEVLGVVFYRYEAKNKSGYSVTVYSITETAGITIKKP